MRPHPNGAMPMREMSMSEIPPYDDEIDLFELIETLWANKLAIITATMLSMMGLVVF
jgi:LPS O-antigen subunit length determinant protein (WzzB/FepE family)